MNYSEADTRVKLIDPQLKSSLWEEDYIVREYYFTDGRKLTGNKRGERLYIDYLLKYQNCNLAIIEAKRNDKNPTEGLQQAIDYALKLNVTFVFATNGIQIYQYSISKGAGDYIQDFPTPEQLFSTIYSSDEKVRKDLATIPFLLVGGMKARYYQEVAVNKTIDAIAKNQNRILLTLATGTGKTFIAFQIVYKLFTARWNIDNAPRRPKILFLADRNILADQAINTFNPLEKDLLKINGDEIRSRGGNVPTNANIFFAIYQAISEKENIGGYYKQYPADFFDLVIVDECHRGIGEGGSWKEILNYFSSAIHLGLTATPKRDDNINTYSYFGKPIYEYSLKQGINDGFLTPYKVKRIKTNIDEYLPTSEDKVISGELEERLYELNDFEKNIILPQRTELIAKTILQQIQPFDKTIIFCVNQTHALALRDAINKYKTVKDANYCVRITSDEGELGRRLLEKFQDNDKDIPTILTSSQMLTTGVDARNVRNVVLVRVINSLVEFKQIVGRGTRVFDSKDFFTIIDFTGATNLFYDDEWDGLPDQVEIESIETDTTPTSEEPDQDEEIETTEKPTIENEEGDSETIEIEKPKTAIVQLSNGRVLKVIDIEVRYVGNDGKPLTTTEFIEKLIGSLPRFYQTENELRKLWSNPESREDFLQQLAQVGFDEEQISTLQQMFAAEQMDLFDLLAHLSYQKSMVTRTVRAATAKSKIDEVITWDNAKAKEFLNFILDRYKIDGLEELKRDRLSELIKLNGLGTTKDAAQVFGNIDNLISAFYNLQTVLYKAH
ncbi:MAG: DEAD/DEAH box helicase family protein [Ferruginibacter sp.]|nr:DEAD/DEAH box helicase family protein [Ferruginibacter sp.]